MTEDEINDAAAEIDTVSVTGGEAPRPASESYRGDCVGGPWDGRDAESRFPAGFLLIHKPDSDLWIYDRGEDGKFYVRWGMPEKVNDARRLKAADEADYDIRVLDPAVTR